MKSENLIITNKSDENCIQMTWDDNTVDINYESDIDFTDFTDSLIQYYDKETKLKPIKIEEDDKKVSLVLDTVYKIINEYNKQFIDQDENTQ